MTRCTIERPMRQRGLQDVWRDPGKRTTVADKTCSLLPDLVNRQFHASRPNGLWVAPSGTCGKRLTQRATWYIVAALFQYHQPKQARM